MNAREAVLEMLRGFDERRGTLEAVIDRVLGRAHIDHRDRRFAFEAVNGILRHRIRLDYTIERYLDGPNLMKNHDLVRVLELGAYQILHMDKVPHHAAVNEAVMQAKANHRIRKYSGIVNALLRAVIAKRGHVALPDPKVDLARRLGVEYSHPRWMVQRWLDTYGLDGTRKLLAFNNEIPQTFLRRKMRGISRQQFEAESRELVDRATGYSLLYYHLTAKGLAPEDIRLFQLGACTVQSPSAGWVVATMDIRKGERVIDLCSAPGGKAALIVELAGEEGSVVACDSSPRRLWQVVETRDRMGLRGMFPVVSDGTKTPFAGYFDKALLDVPCSGTGVLHRHPDARLSRTKADIDTVVGEQEALLEAGTELVGTGGVLVYATCSLEPEENEQQVAKFLERHSEFVVERPPPEVPRQYVDLDGYLRITPFEHGLDGAFAARLRRR